MGTLMDVNQQLVPVHIMFKLIAEQLGLPLVLVTTLMGRRVSTQAQWFNAHAESDFLSAEAYIQQSLRLQELHVNQKKPLRWLMTPDQAGTLQTGLRCGSKILVAGGLSAQASRLLVHIAMYYWAENSAGQAFRPGMHARIDSVAFHLPREDYAAKLRNYPQARFPVEGSQMCFEVKADDVPFAPRLKFESGLEENARSVIVTVVGMPREFAMGFLTSTSHRLQISPTMLRDPAPAHAMLGCLDVPLYDSYRGGDRFRMYVCG